MSILKTLTMNLMHDTANANSALRSHLPYIERLREENSKTDTELLNILLGATDRCLKRNQDALDIYYSAIKKESLI